ncbi:tRNA (adenosine(37)-N6)-threonylcarbamoyltransferase complex ATPase subunit type 1 TsaE [Patescibacteria group bacterium]|nr:tRNA (adenosine(37)-N6)-threonylcarbamoyltransferase complex ATPase subunit type 1 TsaE [Patescibacteria group bacterium]
MISRSKIQTQKVAKELACATLNVAHRTMAVVVGLSGELGSGKTTFVQGFAKSLGIKKRVISPTFIIMKKFEIRSTKSKTNSKSQIQKFKNLYHLDAYRIDNLKEILDLGWRDVLANKENIILVEWAEKIKKIFPRPHFWIKFIHKRKNTRGIDIQFVK